MGRTTKGRRIAIASVVGVVGLDRVVGWLGRECVRVSDPSSPSGDDRTVY